MAARILDKVFKTTSLRSNAKRVSIPRLRQFYGTVFRSFGLSKAHSQLAADVMIWSDERGIDTHGVLRLKAYVGFLGDGSVNAQPNVRVIRDTETTATVDGDNGLGIVVGALANDIALGKAQQWHSGWVAVRNSNHFGSAGYYTSLAASRQMIGFAMSNASPMVAPFGGCQPLLGSNPFSVGFPHTDVRTNSSRPMIADLATSSLTLGRLHKHAASNEPLPNDSALDAFGNPSTSAESVKRGGMLQTMGGPKGYCLVAMVDVLSGILGGANFGPFVPHFTTRADRNVEQVKNEKGVGHLFGALKVEGFRDFQGFNEDVCNWQQTMHNCRPLDAGKPVLVPGEIELNAKEDTKRNDGILIPANVWDDLRDIANDTHTELP